MPNKSESKEREFLHAFQSRDFGHAALFGCALFREGHMDHRSALAMIVSLLHAGLIEEANGLGELFICLTASHRWPQGLLKLLLGKAESSDLVALAENEQQQCQFHFYLAHHLLLNGEVKAAAQEFATCTKQYSGECWEQRLAPIHFSLCVRPYSQTNWVLTSTEMDGLKCEVRQIYRQENEPDPLEGCLNAFESRDFMSVVQVTRERIRNGHLSTRTMLMLITSLQHLGEIWEVESLSEQFLEHSAGHPFPNALLRLLLGKADTSEVLGMAKTDHDRCTVHFYAASRNLYLEDMEGAKTEFEACFATKAECREMRFAKSHYELVKQIE